MVAVGDVEADYRIERHCDGINLFSVTHHPQCVAHTVIGGDVHVRRAVSNAFDNRIHGG